MIYREREREMYTYMFKSPVGEEKIAELENLRKKHDMLSMSLEEDTKSKTKALRTSWTRHTNSRQIY